MNGFWSSFVDGMCYGTIAGVVVAVIWLLVR